MEIERSNLQGWVAEQPEVDSQQIDRFLKEFLRALIAEQKNRSKTE